MSGYILTTTTADLRRQADAALAAIEAANGGTMPATLREAHPIAPQAFADLIAALVNLGADVDQDLIDLAGLRELHPEIPGEAGRPYRKESP